MQRSNTSKLLQNLEMCGLIDENGDFLPPRKKTSLNKLRRQDNSRDECPYESYVPQRQRTKSSGYPENFDWEHHFQKLQKIERNIPMDQRIKWRNENSSREIGKFSINEDWSSLWINDPKISEKTSPPKRDQTEYDQLAHQCEKKIDEISLLLLYGDLR